MKYITVVIVRDPRTRQLTIAQAATEVRVAAVRKTTTPALTEVAKKAVKKSASKNA